MDEDLECVVIVPVKGAPHGKSRLTVPGRADLSRAFAADTIDAVVRVHSAHLVVVTADPVLTRYARAAGALVVPDAGSGLNAAVAAGMAAGVPFGALPMAAMLGDLPAVTPEAVRSGLMQCAAHERAFVPDLAGTGTVLLWSRDGWLQPAFGPGSAAAHEALGYVRCERVPSHLRLDVDVRADLAVAIELGCGRHTAAALAAGALSHPVSHEGLG